VKKMKKLLLTLLTAVALIATNSANAAVLNFDDITTDWYSGISNGYGSHTGFDGFDWGGTHPEYGYDMSIVMKASPLSTALPAAAIVSGEYAANNNDGSPLTLKAVNQSQTFTFNSAYFTATMGSYSNPADRYKENLQTFILKAYGLKGETIFEDSITLSSLHTTFYEGKDNYQNIASLVMYSRDATMGNNNFWMDNFTYNEIPTPAPEPSSMILGLMGLGSMLGLRRRK
jgi:hypothetical protein